MTRLLFVTAPAFALLTTVKCPGRDLAAARRDAVKDALIVDETDVLLCEEHRDGFACAVSGYQYAWCPRDESTPCLLLDSSQELPW